MKREDINIRDPYVLNYQGKYYLYGTRSATCWSKAGYAVGLAISENGHITGPWQQLDEPLWPENGGHGMSFIAKDGKRYFTLHYPNDKYAERPVFYPITVDGDNITLEK